MQTKVGVPGAHASSFYAASINDDRSRPSLVEDLWCDICVVGAGFTGMSVALELACKGYDVVVLESERVGWGASGRNGGQLINGYSRPLDVIGRRYGPDAERALGAMALEGSRIIRERVAEYEINCDLVDGNLVLAFNRRQLRHLEQEVAVWHRHGHVDIDMVDASRVTNMIASDRYVGGTLDRQGGHFHPLNYVLGEARAFESLGGRIFERSRALHIDGEGASPSVRTARGSVTAAKILLCGNAYLSPTVPQLSARVMPVSSQIIATEPLGDLAEALLPQNFCVEDSNYMLDYFRRTADGRLLYGGGSVYGGSDPASIEGKIRPHMVKIFPQLRDVRVDYAWSGLFALTLTRIPQIGRLTPDIYFSHGDSGHGVTTTQLLGRLLAEGVAGQLERFDAFADLPYFSFPGGQHLRIPLTVLGSWYYMFRDRLGW